MRFAPANASSEDSESTPFDPFSVPPDFQPSDQEYRTGARVLLHLARQPQIQPSETAPESLTQAGIARALGTSRVAVTHAVKLLVDGGALRVETRHVRGRLRRVKVYQLTARGEELVRHIRSGMGTPRK